LRGYVRTMKKSIFRKVALERLSSPDRLDRLIRITGVRSWLMLAAIVVILAFVLIWAVFGEIPVTVRGQGILLKPGGIIQIQHGSPGIVIALNAKPGDQVKSGDVIARLNQDELADSIKELRREIESLLSEKSQGTDPSGKKRELAKLEARYARQSNVISAWSGRVIEVYVNAGSYIGPGDPVVSLEPAGEGNRNLEAVIYVPSGTGERILSGMDAQISPSSVKKEEYGFLAGKVNTVTNFPASRRALLNTLGSEGLVNLVSAEGPVIAVTVELIPLSGTSGAYTWSSTRGPEIEIRSGTLCDAVIVTGLMKPIQFLFPGFSRME
jgi:biotin carboxyl carrier protein